MHGTTLVDGLIEGIQIPEPQHRSRSPHTYFACIAWLQAWQTLYNNMACLRAGSGDAAPAIVRGAQG